MGQKVAIGKKVEVVKAVVDDLNKPLIGDPSQKPAASFLAGLAWLEIFLVIVGAVGLCLTPGAVFYQVALWFGLAALVLTGIFALLTPATATTHRCPHCRQLLRCAKFPEASHCPRCHNWFRLGRAGEIIRCPQCGSCDVGGGGDNTMVGVVLGNFVVGQTNSYPFVCRCGWRFN